MSIPIQSIYETTKSLYHLHLLTGSNGLTREFTWVQLCEDIGNASFFRGNELIITTGLSANHAGWLQDFIKELIRHHACGLIIYIGKYIQENDITPNIIAYCQEQHFPLFILPWKVHLADIMQDYCERLLRVRQKEMDLERLLRSLLMPGSHPKTNEEALQELRERGLEELPFSLFAFPLSAAQLTDEQQQSVRLAWKRRLNHLSRRYSLFFYKRQLILILANPQEIQPSLLQELKQLLPQDTLPAASGESRIHTSWQELSSAYAEACAAAAVAHSQQKTHLRFDELGIFRLFFTSSDPQLLHAMRDEELRPLQEYDRAHHAHFLDTLRAYLFHGNSLQQTAALTFTHRNTVNYRMNKIRELTGSDFTDSVVCFRYILAFYLDDYLRLHEAPAQTT